MGMLAKSATKKEFDLFKTEILKKIYTLQKNIDHKVSDTEENINNIEKKANESIFNIENQESSIEEYIAKIEESKNEVREIVENLSKEYTELKNSNMHLTQEIEETKSFKENILLSKTDIDNSVEEVSTKIRIINEALSVAEDLPNNIENIQNITNKSNELYSEIEALQSHSIDKKSKIDKLYNEIYGQDIENENGEIEHTDGLIDSLQVSYNSIDEKLENIDEILDTNLKDNLTKFNTLLEKSNKEFKDVKNKLITLLPGAMASGLSSAYIGKTEDEKTSKEKLEKNFQWSIIGLLIISLIPVSVDIYRLVFTEANLVQVIKDTPNLIISIFPIYFPILWFAYSSNKKLNLSKRLIEEYTHKAVLGNTFEGLSTQIETLNANEDVRNELRTKLLFNLLQVSSENPGKLITDYQTSDHPLMEALENSSKLSESIDKLNKIPGFSSITKKLSVEKNKIIKDTQDAIDKGLDLKDKIDSNT